MVKHDHEQQRRRSLRLQDYDYARTGTYFVTIVLEGRTCLFGDVKDEIMCLNDAGQMVGGEWRSLPRLFPGVELDLFVVMPNHIHGLVVLTGSNHGLREGTLALGRVIGGFKSRVTVEYARGVRAKGWPPFSCRLWQRNYYDHVVRSDQSLSRIRQYIAENPMRWACDRENPQATDAL